MAHPEVATSLGRVQGRSQGGVDAFLGIPYAAPPVGELRFAPPAPALPFGGVREASVFGPAPPQPDDGLSFELGLLAEHPQSEDCLTLNVWRPAPAGPPRAVMVWIHGGAFQTGTAAGPAYDGAALARRGDVLVVTLNYRVGALGFLRAAGHANFGLLDQIAALRFVQREIASFGGDPARVTVFGESAGAGSIVALLAMPAARGAFARAIIQSAAPEGMLGPDEADERARVLAKALDGDAGDLAWWRALPVERLIAAQARVREPGPRRIGMFFAPVVDGATLPDWPLAALACGEARATELVVGTTADEMSLYHLAPDFAELPEAALPQLVAARLRGPDALARASAVVVGYAQAGETPRERFFALETDASLFFPATRLAEAQSRVQPRTFMYRFTWRSPLPQLGACHALDIGFALGTHARPGLRRFCGDDAAAGRVAHAMMDAWASFAKSGVPSPGAGLAWPTYEATRRATLEIGDPCRVLEAPNEARRRLWAVATAPGGGS